MNAYSRTAIDLAAALMGKRRVSQTVHVSTRTFRDGRMARALVLVVPEGSKTGEYFEVFSDSTIDALEAGTSPEDLCLEPYEPEDEDDEREFTIRDHSRAMARSGAFGGR
jgi:hypothetical protein